MNTTKTVKTFSAFGYVLESNSCTAYTCRIFIKRFMIWSEQSLNCIEIFKLMDESDTTAFLEDENDNNLMSLENDDLRVVVVFPKKEVQ